MMAEAFVFAPSDAVGAVKEPLPAAIAAARMARIAMMKRIGPMAIPALPCQRWVELRVHIMQDLERPLKPPACRRIPNLRQPLNIFSKRNKKSLENLCEKVETVQSALPKKSNESIG